MAHKAQHDFFIKIKEKFPNNFKNVVVYDFGSRDINGSLKDMFENSSYTGIDIHAGKNVDIVCKAHEFKGQLADTVVSGSMLEHDLFWDYSLLNMFRNLKDGGLMVVSAAGPGFQEHGTRKSGNEEWGSDPDYYKNITFPMLVKVFDYIGDVKEFYFEYGNQGYDTYFYLIK